MQNILGYESQSSKRFIRLYSNRRIAQSLIGKWGIVGCSTPAVSTWKYEPLGSIAMNDLRTLLRPYAVAVVQNQTRRTLTAWYTGLKAVALYHSQWYIHIQAGYGAGGATLIKHKAPLHWTSHSCGRQQNNQWPTKISNNKDWNKDNGLLATFTLMMQLQVSLNFL